MAKLIKVPTKKPQYYELPYHFNDQELIKLGLDCANAQAEIRRIKRAKSEAAKGFAMQLETAENNAAELYEKRRNGYELREIECTLYYSSTHRDMKSIIREDTGEYVRDEPLLDAERQPGLDLAPPPEEPAH